jgi:hypothetical protein
VGALVLDETDVRRILREELERVLGRVARPVRREMLSKRAAAKMLGVDRGEGLSSLVADGHLREVPFRGGTRIPREDVERVIANGAPSPGAAPKRRPGAAGGAAALRALALDDL